LNWIAGPPDSFRRAGVVRRLRRWNNGFRAGRGPGEAVVRQILVTAVVMTVVLAGCAGALDKSVDFDRHRYSQLVQPFDRPDKIYFDVIFGADFPADNPAADQSRAAWLDTWLKQRHLCPAGYEVVDRRPFDYLEDNPAGYQQRWEIRCLAGS
jgi:hypothetical protein